MLSISHHRIYFINSFELTAGKHSNEWITEKVELLMQYAPFSLSSQYYIFTVTRGPFIEPFYQCVTYGAYTADWQEKLYAIFTLVFMFIIPLGILIYSYVSTIKAIVGESRIRCWRTIQSFCKRLIYINIVPNSDAALPEIQISMYTSSFTAIRMIHWTMFHLHKKVR